MTKVRIAPETTPVHATNSLDDLRLEIQASQSQMSSSMQTLKQDDDDDDSSTTSVGSAGSGSIARPNLKRKDAKSNKRTHKFKKSCSSFWIRFSCMFLSRIFLRHRNVAFLIIEVLVPIAIMAAIVAAFTSGISWKMAYYEKENSDNRKDVVFPRTEMSETMKRFRDNYMDKDGRVLILFTPVEQLTVAIMTGALEKLNLNLMNNVDPTGGAEYGAVGLNNIVDLIEKALIHRDEKMTHGKPIGVFFDYNNNTLNNDTHCPYLLSFFIRHFDEPISNTSDPYPYVIPDRSLTATSKYIETGFIGLQYAIEDSYFKYLLQGIQSNPANIDADLQTLQNLTDAPGLTLQMFYFPNFYNNNIRTFITFVICFCLVVAYIFTSFFILRQIVQENQSGIKEVLQQHGMPTYWHWLILFVHALLFRGITAGGMTVILSTRLTFGKIIAVADLSLIFIILWVHLLALTFFNFFLASAIKSASFIGAYAAIIGLASFVAPTTFYKFHVIERVGNFIVAFFFPNWALYNVFYNVVNFECNDIRASWKNIFAAIDQKGDTGYLTIFEGLLVMGCSGVFYIVLATYFNLTSETKMFPPTLKWWDCFGKRKQHKENTARLQEVLKDINEGRGHNFEKPAIYEEHTLKKKCYVRVRHLCKRFGKHTMALDTINLDIMHEEITVVLGHAGSGKSTLISILAGMLNPTAGYATVKDHDVIFEAKKVRNFIGLCSQTLIYYNLLSVKQHLYLCYRLRGYTGADCTRNSSTLLTRLRLWNIRNYFPDAMTKDELRRLNIAMAMADSPKVLLLDEPTSGMDAFGRREIWKILKILKRHHTIITTTNYMDEAEYLADKIALLAHGRLVCYGSLEFLKKQYDTGYFLRCVPFNDMKLDAAAILALVKSRVGEDAVEKKTSSIKEVDNIIIELPIVDFLKFSLLCQDFDQQQLRMGMKQYSFKQIGLNDIFIKICESIAIDKDVPDLYVRRDSAGDIRSALTSQIPIVPESGRYMPNIKNQFQALVLKRVTYMVSNHYDLLWQLLAPLGLIFVVMFVARVFAAEPDVPIARNMTLEYFTDNLSVFSRVPTDDYTINYNARIDKVLGSKREVVPPRKLMLSALKDLIRNQKNNLGAIKRDHMTALEFLKTTSKPHPFEFIGYFASGALHSAPVILNTIMNIILGTLTKVGQTKYQMYAINHPLPLTTEAWNISHQNCGLLCLSFALVLSFAFGFISASTSIFPTQERRIGLKHLQLMTGLSPWLYWLGNFVCDAVMMILITMVVGFIFTVDRTGTFGVNAILVMMLITVLYLGWSGLAFSYFISHVMPLKFRGFTFTVLLHMTCLLVFIFLEFTFGSSSSFAVFLRLFMMIFPGFAVTCAVQDWFNAISRRSFCKGLVPHVIQMCGKNARLGNYMHFKSKVTLYDHITKTNVRLAQCCDRICQPKNSCFKEPGMLDPHFEKITQPGLITDIVALTLTGLFYWILLLVAEKRITKLFSQKVVANYLDSKKGNKLSQGPPVPKDIKHESMMVKSILNEESFPSNTAVVIQGLTKCSSATILVNDFNLQVVKGECIGILGAGGSGKTTIVNMIAGIATPTKGMCFIRNASLVKNRKNYLSSFGYCPQENCLFDSFTGIQMLELMGRLRGIPNDILSSHVAKWLQVMGLSESGQDMTKAYGLDMKRRLCCGMALIGQCPILLLDEATTGIGPVGRERFWAVLEHLKDLGHTIIFTTFRTEECVQLSTKLVVVADGNAQCLGKPDDIRKRYAKGYCLTFRMRHEVLSRIDIASSTMGRIVEFKKAIHLKFSNCDLLDEQDNLLMYFLRDPKVFWGDVFRRMSDLVTEYSFILSSYDVTEATLDELFILLTNKYREMGAPRRTEITIEAEMSKEESESKALEKAARALHMKI